MSVAEASFAGLAGPGGHRRRVRGAPVLRYSTDVLLAGTAMFGLAMQPVLGGLAALIFLLVGVVMCALRPGLTLAGVRQLWPFIAVALWAMLTWVWSDYPGLSLRGGLQLLLTVVIGAAIVTRVSAATFVKLVFLTAMFEGVASVLIGQRRPDGGLLGIFGSKNAFAGAMSGLMIVSVALLLDRRISLGWRLAGLFGFALGSVLMVLGNSTGALVTNVVVMLALGAILILRRLPMWARVTALVLGLLAAVLAVLMVLSLSGVLADAFLDATGKDVTLTGRTDLWTIALRLIAEHPLLGAGYQAFWVHGNPLAEELWARFYIESRGGFNFHNTPLSNAVEIGFVGVALQTLPLFLAGIACFAWVLSSRSAEAVFLDVDTLPAVT